MIKVFSHLENFSHRQHQTLDKSESYDTKTNISIKNIRCLSFRLQDSMKNNYSPQKLSAFSVPFSHSFSKILLGEVRLQSFTPKKWSKDCHCAALFLQNWNHSFIQNQKFQYFKIQVSRLKNAF